MMFSLDPVPVEERLKLTCDVCFQSPVHFRLGIPQGAGKDFRKAKVLLCIACASRLRDVLRRGLRVSQKMADGYMNEGKDASQIQKRA